MMEGFCMSKARFNLHNSMLNHLIAELWKSENVMSLPVVELVESVTGAIAQASDAWHHSEKFFWTDTLQELADILYVRNYKANVILETLEIILNANIELYLHLSSGFCEMGAKETDFSLPASMVVFGGHTTCGDTNLHAWKLSDNGKSWEMFYSMPAFIFTSRSLCCQVGKGVVVLQDDNSIIPNLWYDMDNNQWTNLPPLPTPGCRTPPIYCNGMLYALGGRGARHKTLECLDLASKSWQPLPSMLKSDEWPLVTCLDGKLYVIFNACPVNEKFGPFTDIVVQCYDIATGVWSFRCSLPSEIRNTRGATLVASQNCIFLLGGPSKLCACYYPSLDRWILLSKPSLVHWYGTGFHHANRVYLCGGSSTGYMEDPCADVEVYDVDTDRWSLCDVKLPTPLHRHLVTVD